MIETKRISVILKEATEDIKAGIDEQKNNIKIGVLFLTILNLSTLAI